MDVKHCLSCSRSENEFPLVVLQFLSKQIFICPQCLPTLIHQPEKLAEKIESA